MSEQAIVEKIIADAQKEAEAIIANAQAQAESAIQDARARAERRLEGERAAAEVRARAILEGKAASARLDSAKIALGDRRAVIDEIYSRALKRLCSLGRAESFHLVEMLLEEYAEEGDEIEFSKNFAYAAEAAKLDVISIKKLKISSKKAEIEGGMILVGKNSDKDLSYGSILAADREEHQAEIAAQIFSV